MKKTILLLLAAIGFFLLPSSKVLAQAQVVDEHVENDLSGQVYYPCGIAVTIEGTESYDYHKVLTKNRASYNVHLTSNLTGTDVNGNTYISRESLNLSNQVPLVNGGYTLTVVQSTRFVSQGSAPNFSMTLSQKITVNANGERTVDQYNVTTSCE